LSIEDQVRLRLQSRLAGAGVKEREVAVEVLFWLPMEFVKEYEQLFARALSLGDRSSLQGMAGDEGRSVKKVKSSLHTRKPKGEAGAGKARVYRGEWIVKDEIALEIKKRVDRRLRGVVQGVREQVLRELKKEIAARGSRGGEETGREIHGSTPGSVGSEELETIGSGSGARKRCQRCGKLMKGDWVRCPYPHA